MPVDTSFYNTKSPDPINPLKTIADITGIQNAQLQNQRGQVALSKEQADLTMNKYNYLNKIMGDLSAKASSPGGISQKEMIDAGVNAVAGGAINVPQLNAFMQTWGDDTPQNNASTIANMQYKIQDAAKQHAITYGTPATVQNGGTQQFGVTQDPQFGGGVDIANSIKNTLTPQDKATTLPVLNNKNEHVLKSKGEIFTDTGEKRGYAPPSTPQELSEEKELQDAIAQPSIATTNNELRTEQAPGEALDQEEQAKQGVALQHIADAVPQRKALLGELEGIVKSGDVNFGPGSTTWKEALGSVQRLYGGDSETVAKYDTFNKLATQLAQQQFQSLGGTGTDTKLGSAISASPNTSLSNKSNAEIIALLKGNEDAIAIKNREWQDWKKNEGAGSYARFSSDFNTKFDPRVFQARYMAPADRKAMIRALSPEELKKYKTDYQIAGENGWIK